MFNANKYDSTRCVALVRASAVALVVLVVSHSLSVTHRALLPAPSTGERDARAGHQ